jgi:hypothetical protein
MLLAPHAHAEPEMSQRQREAIEYALQNTVNDLVAQKNDSGRTYRRGTFSREFRHILAHDIVVVE